MQILDDGRVTDSQGRVVSFKNAIIILTSNLGSAAVLEVYGDKQQVGAPHPSRLITTRAVRLYMCDVGVASSTVNLPV
jgi:ATP-dependent Clp protease ATP-binding subunit ClpA